MTRDNAHSESGNALRNVKSEEKLSQYLNELRRSDCNLSFAEYFVGELDKKGLTKADVISKSLIDRVYAYQILAGSRNAGRDKVITLCIAADMSLDETQQALAVAQQGVLYPRSSRDSVIIYAINTGLGVIETNNLLLKYKEEILA